LLVLQKKILFETHIIVGTCTNKMLLHLTTKLSKSRNSTANSASLQALVIRGIKRNRIEYYRVCILAERSKELTDSVTEYTVTR